MITEKKYWTNFNIANTLLRFKIIQYHPSSVRNNAADITKIEGIKG